MVGRARRTHLLQLALLATVACSSARAGREAVELEPDVELRDAARWPRTVNEAVDTLLASLSTADRTYLRAMPRDSLVLLHEGLGTYIRNDYGLWRGNLALMESCGQDEPPYEPDSCSMLIIEKAWERLQTHEQPPDQRLQPEPSRLRPYRSR